MAEMEFPAEPEVMDRLEAKKAATLAFAKANPIDKKIFDTPNARFGIVTTGKGHLDLMEALRLLGIDSKKARRIGLDVYKVGMVWPLEHDAALDFVRDKHEVLVVEEKRGIIESQFKEYFYDYPGRKPKRMVGKEDENGDRLVPWVGRSSAIFVVLHLVLIAAGRQCDPLRELSETLDLGDVRDRHQARSGKAFDDRDRELHHVLLRKADTVGAGVTGGRG